MPMTRVVMIKILLTACPTDCNRNYSRVCFEIGYATFDDFDAGQVLRADGEQKDGAKAPSPRP